MISKIYLSDYRNFEEEVFSFSPKTTIIYGPNGAGKTNIIESLYLLATGKSFRVRVEEEMVRHDREIARVQGIVKKDDEKIKLEVVLTRGEVAGQRTSKKRVFVNKLAKRLSSFTGNFNVVLFGPWDMSLVSGSPSGRRDFLDTVLCQVDHEYYRSLLSYEKGLRQRNKLLLKLREEGVSDAHLLVGAIGQVGRGQLIFWDKLLIKNGDYISSQRQAFVEFINSQNQLGVHDFEVVYDKSAISEARLNQYAREEVAAAATLVGPHRDDLIVLEGKDRRELSKFGSRGEQRMAILWLKLAEMAFIKLKKAEDPTILLDDIFSELDHEHRDLVSEVVKGEQTIITTADLHFAEGIQEAEKIDLTT